MGFFDKYMTISIVIDPINHCGQVVDFPVPVGPVTSISPLFAYINRLLQEVKRIKVCISWFTNLKEYCMSPLAKGIKSETDIIAI